MNQNNGMQKRMLIMTLVVFVFFIAYEFLVLKPQQEAKAALAKQEQTQKQNSAPDVNASNTQMVSTDVNGNPIELPSTTNIKYTKQVSDIFDLAQVTCSSTNSFEFEKGFSRK